jgi:hypothetical protein
MQKIINSRAYELNDEVFIIDPYSREQIYTEAWLINPGFRLSNNDYVFDAYYSEYELNQKQLYFLHIPRTSGMSIKYSLMKSFSNYPIYSNFIQHLDNERMAGSKLISGHFARYPIELAKSNSQELITYTALRDPLDRYISQFLYTLTLSDQHVGLSKKTKDQIYSGLIQDKPSLFIDALYSYAQHTCYDNVQAKHLTHTIDTDLVDRRFEEFRSGLIEEDSLHTFFIDGMDLKKIDGLSVFSGLDEIDLVDIVGTTNNKLRTLVKENFNIDIGNEKNNINSSFVNSKDFIKLLPNDLKNNILDNNSQDYELYEYAIESRN